MDSNLEVLEKLISIKANQTNYVAHIYNKFHTKLKESIPTTKLLEKLNTFSEICERLNVVKEYFYWTPLDNSIQNKYKKSIEISTTLRNLGNTAMEKSCFVDAVRSYNMAALFAAPGEPDLGLAFANRSIALQSMGLTEEAVKDIDLALCSGYPSEPTKLKKIEGRKKKYEKKISERLKNPSVEKNLQDQISDRNALYEKMFTSTAPNPLAPALENSVDIRWNSDRGRHLVANKNIPIGTTVCVERPFVAILMKTLSWDVDHCHHCLKKNLRCIPCPHCVFAQYCSEKCRGEAQGYHRYECPCLPELHCVLIDDKWKHNFHLAFKFVCLLGPKKLFKIFTERKERKSSLRTETSQSIIVGSDPNTGIYESNSYEAFFNLMSTKIPTDGYYLLILALTLSRTLDSKSDFFASSGASTIEKLEFQDFVAEVIIHHFETFRRNAFGLCEFSDMEGVTLRTYTRVKSKIKDIQDISFHTFAAGTYATISLLNHSCDQNVMRFSGKTCGRIAVVALKPLKAGEELLIAYGRVYGGEDGEREFEARQADLKPYEFECSCIACKNKWPGIDDLVKAVPRFCCPACSAKFPHESKMSPEFEQCKLSDDFECNLCDRPYNKVSFEKQHEYYSKALQVCIEKIVPRDSTTIPSVAAIYALKSALQFFETSICPPSYQCIVGSQLYRDAVNLAILFSDSEI